MIRMMFGRFEDAARARRDAAKGAAAVACRKVRRVWLLIFAEGYHTKLIEIDAYRHGAVI
jgi:hypothetical protein